MVSIKIRIEEDTPVRNTPAKNSIKNTPSQRSGSLDSFKRFSKSLVTTSIAALGVTLSSVSFAADDGSQMSEKFRVNFAGYMPQAAKTALYIAPQNGTISWSLAGSSCSGSEDTYVNNDKSSGDSFYLIDFSECTTPGNNLRLAVGSDQSAAFDIAADPYGSIQYEFFDYFKDHEASATFTQAKDDWATGLNISFSYVKDAGDNGAYPVNTAEASWALINMYESYSGFNNFYSSNKPGARTVYDQLKIMTEQFNHVFDHGGPLAIPKFHTNVNATWASCSPYSSGTCISKPETKATFAAARTLAAMARLHQAQGDTTAANDAYGRAKTALSNGQSNALVCNQASGFGGEGGMYPDNDNYSLWRDPKTDRDNCIADTNNTADDEYAAITELYLAAVKLNQTADAATYKSQVTSNSKFNEASSYWWGAVTMEANLSLLSNESAHTIGLANFKTNLLTKADSILGFSNSGYPGVTWDPNSNQWDSGDKDNIDNNVRWGSHRMALNDARILMAAAEVSKANSNNADAAKYARGAVKVMDHMFGINAINLAMFTTGGDNRFEHAITRTHDAADASDSWPGKMVLGPNNWTNANDGAMPTFGSQPGLKMFALTGTGWSSREISIDANASLVPVAYFASAIAPALFNLDPIGGSEPTNPPAAPSGLSATASGANTINLTWTDNAGSNNDGETGFRIFRNTVNSKPTTAIHTTSANATSWSSGSLNAETTYYYWVEAFNSVGTSASVTANATTGSQPPATNLLTNGDFNNGTTGWSCTLPGGSATCSVVNGEYQVNISSGGSTAWHVQPLQGNLSLDNGKTYTFAFDARASSNRNAEIKVERDGSPWEDFSQIGSGQSLTTSMQRFVYTFTMNTSLNNARVVLNIGNSNHNVIVDNMWLVEGNSDPCGGQVGCSDPADTHTITVSAGANGSITPGTTEVNEGANQTFTISANTGFKIQDVLKNGVSQGAVSSVTFNNVTGDQTLSATFEPTPTFTITVSAGANGSISPGTSTVSEGGSQTFTITANTGFRIADVVKNGSSVGAVSSVSFANVTANQTLSATFEPVPTFTITVSSGANGSISPGTSTVSEGGNQTFTITANSGYKIADVVRNGTSLGAVSSVTFNNVTSNQTLTASFEEDNAVPIVIEAESYVVASGVLQENGSEGVNVGYIDAGDWMSYPTITLPSAGAYVVKYRVASQNGGGTLKFEKAGGSPVYGQINIPSTGNWQQWTTIEHTLVLPAGDLTIGIAAVTGGWNLNWFSITKAH